MELSPYLILKTEKPQQKVEYNTCKTRSHLLLSLGVVEEERLTAQTIAVDLHKPQNILHGAVSYTVMTG